LALGVACGGRRPNARGDNLLLITLDTVRADRLGAYGYAAAETPALDRLAREGVRFESASAAAPLTLPSHATILSGRLPPQHGLRNNGGGRFPAGAPTLAAHLKTAGYETGAFVGSFVLDRRFGLDRGFDTYDDAIERDPDAPSGLAAERSGAIVVDRALDWLRRRPAAPFFLWVHLYDAHAPYVPPEPFATRHAGRPYDGEIAGVDAQVGRLLQILDARGLAGRTLVAVTADHGESLGEHGEPTHGLFVYESTLRVPLLLRLSSVPKATTVREPVSLADLAPTLAGLLEAPFPAAPAGTTRGRDLSDILRRGAEPEESDVYAESEYPRTFGWGGLAALRRGNVKLIAAPRPELYDLARDPHETDDRASSDRRRGPFEAHLATLLGGMGRLESDATKLDAETRERLASLGYAAASGTAPPAKASGASPDRDPKDAVELFRDFETANADLQAGRLDAAARRLEALVAADPGNAVFRGHLAQAHRRRGDFSRALPLYRRAAQDAPEDSDARYNLGVALHETGRFAEALAALDAAVRLDADRAESHNARGIVLLSLDRAADALAALDRAAALDPRDARVHNNRGNILRKMGRFDEAEAAYRRAAELAPRYADPWNGLGTLEVDRDRPSQALACFDAALARAPAFHEVRLNRGIALEMMGDAPGAAAAYRSFLEASRSDPALAPQRRIATELAARLQARR
jgi:arylsulfatase A-like enzyme/tetratricopeptide (TPR) repeat protein